MKAAPVKTVARYIAGWSTIICFVVLLTLIFSFLGTIICAVLAGMMVGPAKPGRWHTVAVSLIFPGVISILMRTSRTELPGRQILVLSLLCFAAFWLTCLVASAVVFYEHRTQAGTVAVTKRDRMQAGAAPVQAATPRPEDGVEQPLSLDALQGKWSCEAANPEADGHRKVMEIKEEQLVLRTLDSRGGVCHFAKGQVRVWSSAPLSRLVVSTQENASTADTAVSI